MSDNIEKLNSAVNSIVNKTAQKTTRDIRHPKFQSRTFWLTVIWNVWVPVSIIAQVIVSAMGSQLTEIPIGTICTFAGTVTTLYIAGNKGVKIAKDLSNKNATEVISEITEE